MNNYIINFNLNVAYNSLIILRAEFLSLQSMLINPSIKMTLIIVKKEFKLMLNSIYHINSVLEQIYSYFEHCCQKVCDCL